MTINWCGKCGWIIIFPLKIQTNRPGERLEPQGVDDNPQILVANAFKARAALKDPQYILNVGDNFYWGGIEKTCGEPMNKTFGLNLG